MICRQTHRQQCAVHRLQAAFFIFSSSTHYQAVCVAMGFRKLENLALSSHQHSIRPTKKHQFLGRTCCQAFQCKPCVGHVPCRAARLEDTGHMCSNVKSIGSPAGRQGLTDRQHGNEVPSDVTWRQRVCRNVKRPGHVTVAERKQPSQPATQNNRGQKLRKLSFELLTCQQLLEPDRA